EAGDESGVPEPLRRPRPRERLEDENDDEADHPRDAREREEEDREAREVVGEAHQGNLLTTTSRTIASRARRKTPGTRRNGKRSSICAACCSKRVFSRWSRMWCMLCSSPVRSVATKDSPPVSLES